MIGPVTTKCKSILIVEDDKEIRETLALLLRYEGYEVFEVANGKEGLDLLPRVTIPCLILLDLMMPVMDGWEFLRAKQTDIKIAPIPVVVVSALDSAEAASGTVGLIKKPIEYEILLQVVRQYCGLAIP
jgi:CheY-like chemotaxis protein